MTKEYEINLEKINLIYIDNDFLCEISKTIDDDLINMCWGEATKDMYNYKQTVSNFLSRIDTRDEAFKVGFIGEFLVHCYFRTFTKYNNLSIFFNNQDKSNKRGFDYMFYDDKTGLWYTEIKSGTEVDNKKINDFNKEKVKESYRDCKDKFVKKTNSNLWNVAKYEVGQKISLKGSLRNKIRKILDSDVDAKIDKVILSTVIFNDSDEKVNNKNELNELKEKYKNDFNKITFLCFRKRTVDKIIQIMKDKLDNEQ